MYNNLARVTFTENVNHPVGPLPIWISVEGFDRVRISHKVDSKPIYITMDNLADVGEEFVRRYESGERVGSIIEDMRPKRNLIMKFIKRVQK